MANPASTTGVPRKILLATDLSARCDRALERAVSLATGWQAALTILHVFEETADPTLAHPGHVLPSWRRPPDTVSVARQRVRQGLRADIGDAVDKASVLVEEGEPARVIERIATSEGSELIVSGIAREEPFARRTVIVGKTVERLLRHSPAPVLIVKNRVRAAYEHILVATDFSDVSGNAMQAALRFFPCQTLHLLHAFEAPYAGPMSDPAQHETGYRTAISEDLESFLASIFIPEDQRRRLVPLIEQGRTADLVRQYVNDRGADLVVLGTHGRGALGEALIGSTAKSILSTLPCDALIVRGPRAPARSIA